MGERVDGHARGTGVPAKAESKLAALWRKANDTRAAMIRMRRALAPVDADDADRKIEDSRLLQANEQLVLSAIRSLDQVDAAERELKEVWHRAEHDALTGLPNRVLLMDRCAHAVANAKRRGIRLALLYLDLNLFKQINDALGHAVGDEVLQHAARCLVTAVRAADTVSRHGGDEFLVLIDEVSGAADARVIAEKVMAALGAPSYFGNQVLHLTASIGISVYPDDGEDVDTLIRKADAAMYRAKKRGGGYVFHGDEPAARSPEHNAHEALQRPLNRYDLSLAEYERLQMQLREANEQLILSVLSPGELQAAAERALQRQLQVMDLLLPQMQHPLAPIRDAAVLLGRVRATQMAQLSRFVRGDAETAAQPCRGQLTPATEVLDLIGIVDTAVAASRYAMEARLQAFGVRVSSGAIEVRGDPTRLVQVLRNLLDNASRYTQHGGSIELDAAVVDGEAVVTVSDNGAGISAEALPDIFEPFVQDLNTIGFNSDGLGIGLTAVRRLVQAQGGEVVASSGGRGRGSRFTVSLPHGPT